MSTRLRGRPRATGVPRAGAYNSDGFDFHIAGTITEGADSAGGTVTFVAGAAASPHILGNMTEGRDSSLGTMTFRDSAFFQITATMTEGGDSMSCAVHVVGDALYSCAFILVDEAGNPRANETGVPWLWFDQGTLASILAAATAAANGGPALFAVGGVLNSDSTGYVQVGIPATQLVPGQAGTLLISNTDGTVTQTGARFFGGPVELQ